MFIGPESVLDSPVVFQSVDGRVEYAANSKYNHAECQVVFKFIDELLKASNIFGERVTAKEIGVITPYSAQHDRIQKYCAQSVLYHDIMAGTGPIFQGKEKLVMIVSMVVEGKCSKFAADQRVSIAILCLDNV